MLEHVAILLLLSLYGRNRHRKKPIDAKQVLSATKLVRLAQRYSEEQGREQARINDVFEDRLADLERRIVDSRDAQPPGIGCRSLHEEFAYSNSRHRSSRPDSPVLPEIPPISAVDLSDWMRGVDERLDDLFERRAASPRERRASADGSNTSSEEMFPIGEIRTIGDKEGRNECAEEKKAATSPPRLYVEPPPAPDIVRLEERLRRLEENASATVTGAASPGGDAAGENWNDSPHLGEESGLREIPPSDGGKRRQSCSEPARRDSLLSSIHSPRFSSVPSLQGVSPERPNADDVATGEEHSQDTIMKAVEESTAESRRARELAEEALRVGREAAARSERTGETGTSSFISNCSLALCLP